MEGGVFSSRPMTEEDETATRVFVEFLRACAQDGRCTQRALEVLSGTDFTGKTIILGSDGPNSVTVPGESLVKFIPEGLRHVPALRGLWLAFRGPQTEAFCAAAEHLVLLEYLYFISTEMSSWIRPGFVPRMENLRWVNIGQIVYGFPTGALDGEQYIMTYDLLKVLLGNAKRLETLQLDYYSPLYEFCEFILQFPVLKNIRVCLGEWFIDPQDVHQVLCAIGNIESIENVEWVHLDFTSEDSAYAIRQLVRDAPAYFEQCPCLKSVVLDDMGEPDEPSDDDDENHIFGWPAPVPIPRIADVGRAIIQRRRDLKLLASAHIMFEGSEMFAGVSLESRLDILDQIISIQCV
jgi:hypothetical protein